jgi:probable rRNA maturation factor
MKRRRAEQVIVDVMVSSAWRRSVANCAGIARRAARATLQAAPAKMRRLRNRPVELAIVLTGDATIRKLNAAYRGKDKPTNVLAFPAGGGESPGDTALLGDVLIAHGTAAREARSESKSLKNHLSHLVVHGVLHLLGYDHQRRHDAQAMEHREIMILAGLGIANPYADARTERAVNLRR